MYPMYVAPHRKCYMKVCDLSIWGTVPSAGMGAEHLTVVPIQPLHVNTQLVS